MSDLLPNFAQLALGSGQRLQSNEVIPYHHSVGIHLHQENTDEGLNEENTERLDSSSQSLTVHTKPRLKTKHTKRKIKQDKG